MANGPDPKQLAQAASEARRLKASLEETKATLLEILQLNAQQSEKNKEILATKAQELELWKQEQSLIIEVQQSQGRLVDLENRRNNALKEEIGLLQRELTIMVQGPRARERALKDNLAAQEKLGTQIQTLQSQEAANVDRIKAKQGELNSLKGEEARLSAKNLDMTEQQRAASVRQLSQEIQLRQAKMATSKQAQESAQMLFGLDSKWRNTLVGALAQQAEAGMRARGVIQGLVETANSLVRSLNNASSVANVAGSTLMKIQEQTVTIVTQIDRSEVALRRATGASADFAAGLTTTFRDREIKRMAASYDELSRMQSALFAGARQYSAMLPSQRMELDRVAMAANRAGVSFEDMATVVDKSTRLFGDRSTAAIQRLYSSAVSIGEVPSRLVKQYIGALDTLAQHSGPRAIQVLQRLSAISKATAIDTRALIDVAKQYDTFEGAANAVARLNTALGGPYLSAIRMLKADEGERLMMLRQMAQTTNLNWKELNKFQRNLIATASGFTSLASAAAFYTGNMDKFRQLTKAQEENVNAQQRLIQAGSSLVTIGQRIGRAFNEFGRFAKEAVPYLRAFAQILNSLGPMEAFKYYVWAKLATAVAAYGARVSAVAIATRGLAGGMKSLGLSLVFMAPLLYTAYAGIKRLDDEMSKEHSPKAYTLPSIMAGGLSQLASASKLAGPHLRDLGVVLQNVSRVKTDSITQLGFAFSALGRAAQTNIEASGIVRGIGGIARAITNLDTKRVQSFASAIGSLSYALQKMPKETVVEVAALTRAQNAGVSMAAGARTGAGVQAGGTAAVQAARQAEPPQGGSRQGAAESGVLVTDNITLQIGDDVAITRRVQDIVRREGENIRGRIARTA